MFKKIMIASAVAAALVFSGCGGDSSGEKRLDAQNELDSGNYEKVISMYEGSASTSEEYNLLASAYMAKAGFTLGDIVTLMDESDSDAGSENGFAKFSSSISKDRSATALQDLDSAIGYYDDMIGDANCSSNVGLTSTQKDVCFFKGLSALVKTGTTLSYLGDLTNFGSSDAGDGDDKLTASTCAMNYAFNEDYDNTKCTLDDAPDPADVTFDSNNTYNAFAMVVNSKEYYYLKTSDSTIITDGNCTTSFEPCDSANNNDCYACPVNQTAGEEDLATTTVLLNLLNNDVDAISSVGGDDVSADIEEFKRDVGGNDGEISEQDLIDYLETENK